MKSEILELLRESKDYVSGQELCEKYGVSRTAIWKAIESLKAEGYPVEAVRNRGYRLLTANVDVYNEQELKRRIHTRWMGKNLSFYEEIGSTNIEAKLRAEKGEADGTLIVADRQTMGRGRRGRSWESPKGENIYFSIMLRPKLLPDQAPMMTLLMAVAVVRGLEAIRQELIPNSSLPKISIKWPNDIVIEGKKLCGMLTEMSVEQDFIQYVVIGTGINVKKQIFAEEIAERAVSLEQIWDCVVPRGMLTGYILSAFEDIYDRFVQVGDLSFLKEEYESYLVNRDQVVRVLDPAGEYEGIARGINEKGELLVEVCTDEEKPLLKVVYAGEVSVRGVYGYV